ncbi:hypothetical protein QOT17_020434 [Balamuthia mandrillaris]
MATPGACSFRGLESALYVGIGVSALFYGSFKGGNRTLRYRERALELKTQNEKLVHELEELKKRLPPETNAAQ